MSETYDLFQQGQAHLRKGRAAQATVALEKAKRREPRKASIREALGIAYLRIQRYEEAEEEYFSYHGTLPCPVLDPETGRCELYSHRPLTCRMFGPPVRIGASDLPPCRLCFQDASPETVEACRVEPDPHGVEDRLLSRLGEDRETLIAFALVLR